MSLLNTQPKALGPLSLLSLLFPFLQVCAVLLFCLLVLVHIIPSVYPIHRLPQPKMKERKLEGEVKETNEILLLHLFFPHPCFLTLHALPPFSGFPIPTHPPLLIHYSTAL